MLLAYISKQINGSNKTGNSLVLRENNQSDQGSLFQLSVIIQVWCRKNSELDSSKCLRRASACAFSMSSRPLAICVLLLGSKAHLHGGSARPSLGGVCTRRLLGEVEAENYCIYHMPCIYLCRVPFVLHVLVSGIFHLAFTCVGYLCV